MLSKEEIEDSIEYKFNNFYNDDTLKLTIEEAKYIFSGQNMFCDAVIDAGAKTLIQYIDKLEQENYKLNDIIENKVHYIKCENCGIEMRVKRSDAKYCKKCSQKLWYKNLSEDKKKQRAEKSKILMQKIRLARKDKLNVK